MRDWPSVILLVSVPAETRIQEHSDQLNKACYHGPYGASFTWACSVTDLTWGVFPPGVTPRACGRPGDALMPHPHPHPLHQDGGSWPRPTVTFLRIRTQADKVRWSKTLRASIVRSRDGGLAFRAIDQRQK